MKYIEKIDKLFKLNDKSYCYSKIEKEENILLCILSYINILVLIPFFISKNKYVSYHSNIGINLFLYELIFNFLFKMFDFIFLSKIIYNLIKVIFFILSILGIINVLNLKAKELPIISKYKLIKYNDL